MTAALIWLVERLMDVLCGWPIGYFGWGGDLYQWVGRTWLYPLLCRQDPGLTPKE